MTTIPAARPAAWHLPVAGVLVIVAVLAAGLGPATLPLLYLAAVTPTLCHEDVRHHRLPNRMVLPMYGVLAAALVIEAVRSSHIPVAALVSGFGYLAFMLALSVAGGMGMGDVKLAGALGLSAGMFGLETAVASPLLAFLTGGVAAVVALIASRGRRGVRIPFGPFMLAGFWGSVVVQAAVVAR
jgi:leader peptidase (prepilin peptidase) / N-methyltransferase